jgi:hypothetical protein
MHFAKHPRRHLQNTCSGWYQPRRCQRDLHNWNDFRRNRIDEEGIYNFCHISFIATPRVFRLNKYNHYTIKLLMVWILYTAKVSFTGTASLKISLLTTQIVSTIVVLDSGKSTKIAPNDNQVVVMRQSYILHPNFLTRMSEWPKQAMFGNSVSYYSKWLPVTCRLFETTNLM